MPPSRRRKRSAPRRRRQATPPSKPPRRSGRTLSLSLPGRGRRSQACSGPSRAGPWRFSPGPPCPPHRKECPPRGRPEPSAPIRRRRARGPPDPPAERNRESTPGKERSSDLFGRGRDLPCHLASALPDLLPEVGGRKGEDLRGEVCGVLRPRFPDRHGRHGYPRRHLDRREKGVEPEKPRTRH